MKPTYEELEAQIKQMEADNEKALSVLKEANDAVLLAKSKFEALAAENAALKEACGGDGSYRDCPACTHSEYIEAPETPATSAFLAEVRAQGVEMLTSKLQSLIDEGNFEGDEIGVIAGAVYTGADIAAQIRKGVQS
ncbi:hypothetical protein [Citrobacter koseri]|uniref:hypothetical protein n=1 Tax=Citrobacter koseri TaxID=545 RepID=UPI0018E10471|nr:hypothetical protein [Citrobacter koseri]